MTTALKDDTVAIVSIAEAILWGEQRHKGTDRPLGRLAVSIAEAILWGEQPSGHSIFLCIFCRFNRRGDSLGGATRQS